VLGGNGSLLGFIIGNLKYPEGLGGPNGFKIPHVGSISVQQKSYPSFWAFMYAQ
jgi:hypothetical protein